MIRTTLKIISILFIFGVIVGCNSNTGNSNTVVNNNALMLNSAKVTTKNMQTDIQQFANTYFESHTNSEHFTATVITTQCGNSGTPVTAFVGQVGINDSRQLDKNSIFQIASITKSFIAVILLQLEQEQQYSTKPFSLNDTVGMWFKNIDGRPTYPEWQKVTIKQLLNMTSGIPNYVDDPEFWKYAVLHPDEKLSPQMVLSYSTNKPILFEPGTNWHYDDSDYFLLGMLIEKITGKDYGTHDPIQQEIKTRITDKLYLHNTYYVPDLPVKVVNQNQLMHGYAESSGGMQTGIPDGTDTSLWSLSSGNEAGAIISTPENINTYINALYTIGVLLDNNQLIQLKSLVSTNNGQPMIIPNQSDPLGYGLGIMSIFFNNSIYYLYAGISPGFEMAYVIDPITFNSVIMAINSTGENPWNGILVYTVNNIMNYLSENCQ